MGIAYVMIGHCQLLAGVQSESEWASIEVTFDVNLGMGEWTAT